MDEAPYRTGSPECSYWASRSLERAHEVKMAKKGLEDTRPRGQGQRVFKEETLHGALRAPRKATGSYKNMSVCGELYK